MNNSTYQQLPVKPQFLSASSEGHLGKHNSLRYFTNLQGFKLGKKLKEKNREIFPFFSAVIIIQPISFT